MSFESAYTPEEALDEAEKLTQKIESGSAQDYTEAEKQVEADKIVKKEEPVGLIEKSDAAKFEELAQDVSRLVSFLKDRDHDGLNQLMDMDKIGYLSTSKQGLLIESGKVDIEELQRVIGGLVRGLEEFGQAPRERVVREDTENLRKITFAVRRIGESAFELKNKLGAKENDELRPIMSGLNRVSDITDKVALWLMKKRDLLERR